MQTITSLLALVFMCTAMASAQERTEETVTTTDSTGKETTVKSVKIAETEERYIQMLCTALLLTPYPVAILSPTGYSLSYYNAISRSITIGGGLKVISWLGVGLTGFGVSAEARLHPSAKAPRGFYWASNISYNWLSSKSWDATGTAFSIGGLVGWQWFPWDGFAIGLGIGVDHRFVFVNTTDPNVADDFRSASGTGPTLRFDIGYPW